MYLLKKTTLINILFWVAAVTYLLFSPIIYANWFLTDEESTRLSEPFPMPKTDDFKANVENLYLYNKQGTYELAGWGFLINYPNLIEEYSREIILVSPKKYYILQTEVVNRKDVNNYFISIQENLTMAGFKSRISKYKVTPGHYHIMLSFKQKFGEVVYADTNHCITRTPNQLILNDSLGCKYLHWLMAEGKNIDSLEHFLAEPDESKVYIDYLSSYNSQGVYELTGWGFLTNNIRQSKIHSREVVLVSPNQYYVFHAVPMQRKDVNEYFNLSDENLAMPGFQSKIAVGLLNPGIYKIYLLFHAIDGNVIYIDTKRCVTHINNNLSLNDNDKSCD
ncbi:MAG: hypothetical protein KGZ86_01940 [Candidatus Latescibacteria bacterium]|nr:hypothetical protein [Candidatus Latescibacterota bacterium]